LKNEIDYERFNEDSLNESNITKWTVINDNEQYANDYKYISKRRDRKDYSKFTRSDDIYSLKSEKAHIISHFNNGKSELNEKRLLRKYQKC
jgi:hypothetical protein